MKEDWVEEEEWVFYLSLSDIAFVLNKSKKSQTYEENYSHTWHQYDKILTNFYLSLFLENAIQILAYRKTKK